MAADAYYPRALEAQVHRASEQFPALLVIGPRQVGKTTLLRQCAEPSRRYVTLDDPSVRELAEGDPALFLQRYKPPVLIDEIQYAPGLLSYVKVLVDEQGEAGMFWLTGSQHFQMMRGVSETLAGRVAILNLLGFSQRERERLDLGLGGFLPTAEALGVRAESSVTTDVRAVYERIWSGSFPALAAGQVRDHGLFYSSYLQTYLQRDVRELAQVGDQSRFLRFIRACAARTGQLLNLSELARDVDVTVKTAGAWLGILEASLQVVLLRPYFTNVTKRLIKTPKLHMTDTGLVAALTEWSTPDTLEAGAMAGAVLETFVVTEILKSWWHSGVQPNVYFYRDKDGREVDLLIERDGKLHPIEVKRSASPSSSWARSLAMHKQLDKPVGEGAVVCLAPDLLPIGSDAHAVPVGII